MALIMGDMENILSFRLCLGHNLLKPGKGIFVPILEERWQIHVCCQYMSYTHFTPIPLEKCLGVRQCVF